MTCTLGLPNMSIVYNAQIFLENENGRFRPRSLRFVWFSTGALFRKPFSNGRFSKILRCLLYIDLLGVETDPPAGRFQLPTPNKSIGPSEVARDGFKAGCFRLPLVGGRFLIMQKPCIQYTVLGAWHVPLQTRPTSVFVERQSSPRGENAAARERVTYSDH
jgi:hypothetical protein